MSDDYKHKSFRVIPMLHRDPRAARYVEEQVALQRTRDATNTTLKSRPVKPEGMSEEAFIMSLQAPSMQATMQRDPRDDERHFMREVPANAVANPDAKTDDERVGKRNLDPDEISHVEATRRRPKNSDGQPTDSSVSPEKREFGIEAFIFTPAKKHQDLTPQEKKQIVNLTPIKSSQPQTEWRPLTKWQALKHWLSGNKVKQEEKK